MHNIIPVKGQQGKGPGDFAIVSLLPQDTPQGLCFLLSLQMLPSWLGSLITLNNMGINII